MKTDKLRSKEFCLQINPFHLETFPSLNLDMSIVANTGVRQKSKQNGNSVDPDETAP